MEKPNVKKYVTVFIVFMFIINVYQLVSNYPLQMLLDVIEKREFVVVSDDKQQTFQLDENTFTSGAIQAKQYPIFTSKKTKELKSKIEHTTISLMFEEKNKQKEITVYKVIEQLNENQLPAEYVFYINGVYYTSKDHEEMVQQFLDS